MKIQAAALGITIPVIVSAIAPIAITITRAFGNITIARFLTAIKQAAKAMSAAPGSRPWIARRLRSWVKPPAKAIPAARGTGPIVTVFVPAGTAGAA